MEKRSYSKRHWHWWPRDQERGIFQWDWNEDRYTGTLEEFFSSWNKMKRVFSLVLKFKGNLLRKVFSIRDEGKLHQQIRKSEQPLNIAEINFAGKKVTKKTQNKAFAEEKSSLVSENQEKVAKIYTKQQIKFDSSLYWWKPSFKWKWQTQEQQLH